MLETFVGNGGRGMAKPVRCRRICFEPEYDSFAPCGAETMRSVTALHEDAAIKM